MIESTPSAATSDAGGRHQDQYPTPGEGAHARKRFNGPKCGATTRRGTSCQQPAMPNGKCRMHGGKSLAGVAHPNFRHGKRSRYSSVLAGLNLERFEDALDDPAHAQMRQEIALLDTLLQDAVGRAQVGRTGEMWDELAEGWRRFRAAEGSGDRAAAGQALARAGEIIADGATAHRAQAEVLELIERRRKLAETERRRMVGEANMISATRAIAFAHSVFDLVRQALAEHVGETPEERLILTTIQAGLAERIRAGVDDRWGR